MEYKFRGQRIDNNEFITGSLIVDEIADKQYVSLSVDESVKIGEEGCLKIVSCEVKKEPISPYSGVKDINKKESYLGDVLKKKISEWLSDNQKEKCEKEKHFLIVKKEKDSNNMYLEYNFNIRGCWETNNLSLSRIEEYEIVGNIFENVDLIKKEV